MKLNLVLILGLLALIHCQEPPIWPSQFTLTFNETSTMSGVNGTTNGAIYFDQPGNRQVVTRQDGKFDRFCGTVFRTESTPCNHIIVNNKRFLDFPKKKYCCFCCDGEHGCGILLKDWIPKTGADYVGTEQLDSKGPYEKWHIKGLQENFYWNKNDSNRTPRKLWQVPNDDMDFNSFTIGKPSQDKFALPSYCTDQCGETSFCAKFRGQLTK